MRLYIGGLQVEQLGTTSGIHTGRNRQYGFHSSKRVSEGFGTIRGEGNVAENGIHGEAGSRSTEVSRDGRQKG